ncbi:hypothetical protein ACIQNU_04160 [Streptomyces sp. NPDC091292]|uniref:hypothetical protein n=1 Tax=Streptomyces sp. NPDC091292 TaxID=3365991 RepID=UPI00382EFC40
MQLLSHYRDSLPPGSPLRAAYAPPAAAGAPYLPAAGVALLGVVGLASGVILVGLAAIVAGIGWGVVIRKRADAADAARAEWDSSLICLACTGTFRR